MSSPATGNENPKSHENPKNPKKSLTFSDLQLSFADVHGVHGVPEKGQDSPRDPCPLRQMVELRDQSSLKGAGRGLFATRHLPRGTPVTWYAGVLISKRDCTRKRSSYNDEELYGYSFQVTQDLLLVGRSVPVPGQGLAQFANDAIHPEISGGISNNCTFEVVQRTRRQQQGVGMQGVGDQGVRHQDTDADAASCAWRVYLVTERDVFPGEELLVSYHISYWLDHDATRISARLSTRLPPELVFWLECQTSVQAMLRECLHEGLNIEEYVNSHAEEDDTKSGLDCHMRDDDDEEEEEVKTGWFIYDVRIPAGKSGELCSCCSNEGSRQWRVQLYHDHAASETKLAAVVCAGCNVDLLAARGKCSAEVVEKPERGT